MHRRVCCFSNSVNSLSESHATLEVLRGRRSMRRVSTRGEIMAKQDSRASGAEASREVARDVSAEVFTAFLQALEHEHVDAAVVQRLRQALVEDKTFSERALRTAVFGEGPARD